MLNPIAYNNKVSRYNFFNESEMFGYFFDEIKNILFTSYDEDGDNKPSEKYMRCAKHKAPNSLNIRVAEIKHYTNKAFYRSKPEWENCRAYCYIKSHHEDMDHKMVGNNVSYTKMDDITHIYRVLDNYNNSIYAPLECEFLTYYGWKKLRNLSIGNFVVTYKPLDDKIKFSQIVLTEKMFICPTYGIYMDDCKCHPIINGFVVRSST